MPYPLSKQISSLFKNLQFFFTDFTFDMKLCNNVITYINVTTAKQIKPEVNILKHNGKQKIIYYNI